MCENVENFARMKCLILPWNENLEKKRNMCILCGNKWSCSIKSKANTAIDLKELLKSMVVFESGILCRNCFQKIINFDKKCRKFYDLCQKTM